jgi:DNA-binding transcriptional regulator YiaG
MTTETMTPEEFRAIRKRWGVSQQQFGETLGVGGETKDGPKTSISRYERGEVPIRPTLAKLTRCLDQGRECGND